MNDYHVHISSLSFFSFFFIGDAMMHKKLEWENCFDRVWSFILSGNKNLEKMIHYVVQNNRKCLQNSQAFIDAERNSFYCIEKN